ncbi:helix-turn-helix domain-containing protein [Winogradskyella flava]|uniref:Helix-turn-helix transcriptional regulator n=1 Tax=Winogradskyella flava TaxID=1884876 RepID=A0A842ISG3_9FLAO|nr:AraC family transcriptional regulator [Winogradskyella flava]MBC2845715.1 helix-turn-helix transcriptional regulator [Winogradskyella flava]
MVKEHLQFTLFEKGIFERVVLKPPMKAPGIMHNEACFLYAVEGESKVFSAVSDIMLRTEEAVVMKCGNYLNDWLETTEQSFCQAIAIHFYPDVLKKLYDKELPEFFKSVKDIQPTCIEKVKSSRLLKNYINSLQFYFENPDLVNDELLKLKLKEIILLLVNTDKSGSMKGLLASLFTPTEYSFKELVEANIYNNLSLDELALLHGVSLSSFKREFNKVYKESPGRYFKRRKLERAAKLIISTNERIGEIAFNCGFSEVAHFSNSFQDQFGCSPTAYRVSQNNN